MDSHVVQPPEAPPLACTADRCPHRVGQRGVTLIELLAVLAIVVVLVAAAVPGLSRLLSSHRAASAANDFVHAIALARSEALKRGRRVYLAPLGLHWRDGWVVFVDGNDDRRFGGASPGPVDEAIFRHGALADSITITNPANASREPFTDVGSPQRTYILFDGHGYPRQRNGAFHPGSLVITDRSGAATTQRTICLAAYGRVRVVERAGCG